MLIVDDDDLVAKTAKRVIERNSLEKPDQILLASTPSQAEIILRAYRVTSVLCDYDLGKNQPKGTELVTRWRRQHASIQTAFIYTGSDVETVPKVHGIEAIFSKTSLTWAEAITVKKTK